MAIVLSSGATLAPSPQTGAWVVSSLYGVTVSAVEHPKAALLLLEEQPTKELVAQLAALLHSLDLRPHVSRQLVEELLLLVCHRFSSVQDARLRCRVDNVLPAVVLR